MHVRVCEIVCNVKVFYVPLCGSLVLQVVDGGDQKSVYSVSPHLTDTFGRHHSYLRISLTERCNLRCECVRVCVCMCVCLCVSSHMYVCIFCMSVCVCVLCARRCVCVCVCVYVCVCL